MNIIRNVGLALRRFFGFVPPKFAWFYDRFRDKEFAFLDVGCGNHSASLTKRWFPACRYYGIDRKNYANDEEDFRLMEKYYEMDLSSVSFEHVPDNYFDVVILNHVIEHLYNGLDVLAALSRKLKPGGVIYVEFPSVRSLGFPNMKGTLNFCDDETHVRVYDLKEVANILLSSGFTVVRAGTRRTLWKFVILPVYLVYVLLSGRMLALLWELLGFAEYVYAIKKT